MRIRKHAKISPLMYGNSSFYPPETLICQLNQSPWDVISFSTANSSSSSPDSCPLQTYQVDVDRLFPRDASFGASVVGASRSVARLGSHECHDHKEGNCMAMEAKHEGFSDGDKQRYNCMDVGDERGRFEEKPETVGFNDAREGEVWRVQFPEEDEEDEEEEEEEVVLCSKTDGKGWQCGKLVNKGQTMCDHHLKQLRNYVTSAGKKAAKSSQVRPKRQTRGKKPAAAAAANPHEFYYYSGFGPLWGKRREPGHATTTTSPTDDNAVTMSSNGRDDARESLGGHGTGSNRGLLPKPRVMSSSSSLETNSYEREEIEYFDDEIVDDDDEDEEGGRPIVRSCIGTKRKRKPIKARSLKSLM